MRVHTKLTMEQLRKIELPSGVYWRNLREYGSRSHDRAFNIYLTGTSSRRPNTGQYGAGDGDDYAATWDEWGVALGKIFELDADARCPYYADAADYHWQTGDRFHPDALPAELCRQHRWEPGQALGARASESKCKTCGAVKRWRW